MSRASVNDTPTANQHRRLLVLGSGAALVIGYRREIGPLVGRGWVEGEEHEKGWAMVRITPDGLRALARSVERYGLPELFPERRRAA